MAIYIKIEEWITRIFLALIVLLVFVAATMRWLGYPLIWSVDMAQLLFIWVCMLGANQALRRRDHIGVDILVRYLPVGARAVLELVLCAVVVGFLTLLIIHGLDLTLLNLERRFGDSNISYAFVTIAVPVGSTLLLVTTTMHMWRLARMLRKTPEQQQALLDYVLDNK